MNTHALIYLLPVYTSKNKAKNCVVKWNELHSALQYVLPPDDDYSYVVETYQEIDDVTGDSPHFSAIIRINLVNEEDAKQWMKMSNHSTCTYRTTKTVKTSSKRVKCKYAKHCQHFAKKLSQKQKEKSVFSRAKKKAKAPLVSQLRNKKTNCPSSFTLVVQIPTKAQKKEAESQPYLLSHCGVLKMTFDRNHPITLSLRNLHTFDIYYSERNIELILNIGIAASNAHASSEVVCRDLEVASGALK